MEQGFREVVIDQPFTGKWLEVDMNLGGGHSTFQGTKFSDFAGGFSYRSSGGKAIVQNRSIYWRTLNDTLELTELSMDFNLNDNQVRYIFQGSPIVGPIAIQETEANIVILVATVTSVNKFVFIHPKRLIDLAPVDKNNSGSAKASIFHQICNKPQSNFRSFSLYDNAVNIPVPLSATAHFFERGHGYGHAHAPNSPAGECLFAFSFDNGRVHVYKISRDDVLLMYDLRQANLFTRLLSGITTLTRTPTNTTDAVIGLNFFTWRSERDKCIQLVTLAMNGHLTLWSCDDLDAFTEWSSFHFGVVDSRFAINNYTDSCMLLRKSEDRGPNGLPNFAIYIPGDGFRVYRVTKAPVSLSTTGQARFSLQLLVRVDFKHRELMDFSFTSEYLFTLVNNPEEETEWEIQSYKFDETKNPVFQTVLLEPLPFLDVELSPIYAEPKEFYMDIIFNKCSFSAQTITKALTMFRKEEDEALKDRDWESLRITAMNILDREIALETSNSEFEISDEEYTDLSLKYWLMFYNSCVEYHIHTVKPLGLFYETNTKMVCIVKKSRISFLRPSSFLETAYFFPESLALSDSLDSDEDEHQSQIQWVAKYLDLVHTLGSIMNEDHIGKVHRRLRKSPSTVGEVCKEIADFILATDPHCVSINERQLVQRMTAKMAALGPMASLGMKSTLDLISCWEGENPWEAYDLDGELLVASPDSFMGSRLGAHLTFKILKQLMAHRFTIARNSMILQYVLSSFFSQQDEEVAGPTTNSSSWEYQCGELTVAYYGLLNLAEDVIEYVPPFIKERGFKIANILRLQTSDHVTSSSSSGDDFLDPFWPTRAMEGFCLSQMGSQSIRSRVNRAKSFSILAHAEAAARCIWTNEINPKANRPFQEFLIIACQYTLLYKYANFMMDYFSTSLAMKQFSLGLANLCLNVDDVALNYFQSINFKEAVRDDYFCLRVLQLPPTGAPLTSISLFNSYYVRVISLFQVMECSYAVQRLAEDAIKVADSPEEEIKMCSLAFKSALGLENYTAAYDYILKMPSRGPDSKEKNASLRMLISKILQEGELDVLVTLNMNDDFNNSHSVREKVESILFSQANLSDPLVPNGVYEMLYGYHLCKANFHKAAAIMYYRAMRIGEKGLGHDALTAQKNCYLDVLTCLNLVERKSIRFIIQKSGFGKDAEFCYDFDVDETQIPALTADKSLVTRSYADVERELQVLVQLKKVEDEKPVKPLDFHRRAGKTVETLAICHYYDDAIKLALSWELDVTPVVGYFTDVCCNLLYNILPESGDPGCYIRYNDTSELPTTETGYTEIALRLLQSYLLKLERPKESSLHKTITLKLLAADVELPQWLVASYKKVNSAQLLRCYTKFGEWEKATALAIKLMDASLGRLRTDEFDPTIKKISSYEPVEPVLPFHDINVLANEMNIRSIENPALKDHYLAVKERANLFIGRVKECTNERVGMFGMEHK